MPDFDVSIKHTVTKYLQVSVTATDEAAAQTKVEAQIAKLEDDPQKLEEYYGELWQEEDNIIEVDDVN